jgi:aspartate racemase
MSWVSTIEYYRVINSEINARRGGLTSARILLNSVDFGQIDELHAKRDFEGVGALLTHAACTLEMIGADCVLLCANTMHMHAHRVQSAVSVPLINLIDVAAKEVKREGISTVGLLGTRLTMERDFYAKRLSAHGVEAIVPEKDEREFINRTIEDELVKSVFRPESRDGFLAVINGLAARGAGGVILGCTEIPLLVEPSRSPVPAFDTTRLHAMAAVDFALSD